MPKTSNLLNLNNSAYDSKKVMQEFSKSLFDNKFFINRDFLTMNSIKVPFNKERWYRRPEVFSLDYYEEYLFYPIILLINKISSRFSFVPENLENDIFIISPNKKSILRILSP
jgi:hypothetical protein